MKNITRHAALTAPIPSFAKPRSNNHLLPNLLTLCGRLEEWTVEKEEPRRRGEEYDGKVRERIIEETKREG